MQLWTLKEAYVKAVGQGISAAPGLKGFSLMLHEDHDMTERIKQITTAPVVQKPRRISFHSDVESEDDWAFMLLSLSDQHTAAICLQTAARQPDGQDSIGRNTCTTTALSSRFESDCLSINEHKTHLGQSGYCRVTFLSTLPLVSSDFSLPCCIEAAGGFGEKRNT